MSGSLSHKKPTFGPSMARCMLPFRSVNRRGAANHDPELQRHHLLPRQLERMSCFACLFESVGWRRVGFCDFRANGLLLPSTERAAIRTRLPLHRGPHRRYNEVVIARVGRIEYAWSRACKRSDRRAHEHATMRLRLLQSALRRQLLSERQRIVLNKRDPIGSGFDFSTLDAMAQAIWEAK